MVEYGYAENKENRDDLYFTLDLKKWGCYLRFQVWTAPCSRSELPDFRNAAITRGKAAIIGHNFLKVSLIPDATPIHTIPSVNESDDFDTNQDYLEGLYTGSIFYSVKDMATEGSSANKV